MLSVSHGNGYPKCVPCLQWRRPSPGIPCPKVSLLWSQERLVPSQISPATSGSILQGGPGALSSSWGCSRGHPCRGLNRHWWVFVWVCVLLPHTQLLKALQEASCHWSFSSSHLSSPFSHFLKERIIGPVLQSLLPQSRRPFLVLRKG